MTAIRRSRTPTGLRPTVVCRKAIQASYDARKDLPGASVWPQAVEHGPAGSKPWGELAERPILQWKDYGVKDFVSVSETTVDKLSYGGDAKGKRPVSTDKRRVVVGKLPYNAHVHPRMSITAPRITGSGITTCVQATLKPSGLSIPPSATTSRSGNSTKTVRTQ